MKKEILRISNYNVRSTQTRVLENLSMHILEGEVAGILGLTYSGKDSVIGFLCGESQENVYEHHVYIDGMRMKNNNDLREKTYRMSAFNYTIEDWTVAEYIGLVKGDWLQIFWKKKRLEESTRDFMKRLEIDIEVTAKMKELSELDKRIVDVAKAIWNQKKLLIIEDEFEGIHPSSIYTFGTVMKRLIKGRMGVIVNSYSDLVQSRLADKYYVFRKDRVVKKCMRSYIRDSHHLEKFLLGNNNMSKKKSLDSYMMENKKVRKELVYRICNVPVNGGKKSDFSFEKGEVVTFLLLDRKEKERLFLILSGRMTLPGIDYFLDYHRCQGENADGFIREKIVSIQYMGTEKELFPYMTASENLLLPSLGKVSSMEYIFHSHSFIRMFKHKLDKKEIYQDEAAEKLERNNQISIVLERWYIYNPKVLILFEPFAHCDVIGVSIVKSYIKKFTNRGTAVIIIKSRDEYIEDISDQIITIG